MTLIFRMGQYLVYEWLQPNRHLILPRNPAITSVMNSSDQVTIQLSYLQD